MPIALTPEQQTILEETRAASNPAEFEALLITAQPETDKIVRESLAPNQPIGVTLTELRDLFLAVTQHAAQLDAHNYAAGRRALFRDAIRLLETAHLWFGEGHRTGAFRVRTVAEVVEASRPWRARLAAYGEHAFAFEPELADVFGDVNTTGTLDEEVDDLRVLLQAAKQHKAELAAVGMSDDFVKLGEGLLREAENRDLLGVLGLRNQEEAMLLRNRILTYAVLLGRQARAAGVNACFDDAEARRRFEAASFREALRRLRPKRRGSKEEPTTPDGAPADS
ncbi:hypothetical protein [Polyangium fumosum]|uniref:Uncharacterized protein n=1 Tax=Polyangium fumosum TaxID=889272 RepID=A0A4U1JFC9_9BACT|nr:hypothetical protein [Polyangium fumosum]TKD09735.1 hypothetical protein E8A74_11235 [Polyangium fumosum]